MSDVLDLQYALPAKFRLQDYEIVRVLGVGGFAITYLAFDCNLNKAVALKEFLPREVAARTSGHTVQPYSHTDALDFNWGLERFIEEARVLARFQHSDIVQVYRFFRAQGTAYIVMEYVEGEPLAAMLKREGVLNQMQLSAILLPLLDGLELVHNADFLHRDIKPGNIILRADGSPVLIDFGAARNVIGAKSKNVTSIITPGYAPIEQYSTKGNQGPWTDIYGLAAVCYRALTGTAPADATDRITDDTMAAWMHSVSGCSEATLNAIDAGLRVNGRERPQNITAWRQHLAGQAAPQPPGSDSGVQAAVKKGTVTKASSALLKLLYIISIITALLYFTVFTWMLLPV